MSIENLPKNAQENIRTWLERGFDLKTKKTIKALLKTSSKELLDAFYQDLSFGTGGLRALSGIGTNRINSYTISFASQAVANALKEHFSEKNLSVVIAFDSRSNSQKLAKAAAKSFQDNGIKVYLGKRPLPTPFLSFCVRKTKAQAGIVITASHNPPKYNGFKVYWEDGGQVLPPYTEKILEQYSKIQSPDDLKKETKEPCISIPKKLESAYVDYCCSLSPDKKLCKDQGSLIKIVYTNLHGTGIEFIPKLFLKMGFRNFSFVEKQKDLDGNFPFAKNPNPEEEQALQLGIEQLVKENCDILLATDPDADRVSCVVLGQEGIPSLLTGNQLACLLLDYILSKKNKALSHHLLAIKTLVTTELFQSICNYYKVQCLNVPTGFKHIAKEIENFKQHSPETSFIFGAEESCGYLAGDQVRDKDACLTASLIAECALFAKVKGKNLVDSLEDLYKLHGFFFEMQKSLTFEESCEGKQMLARALKKFQTPSLVQRLFPQVLFFTDYQSAIIYDFKLKKEIPNPFPRTYMYKLSFDDLDVFIRPSGTEPKIKFYFNFLKQELGNRERQSAICSSRIEEILKRIV